MLLGGCELFSQVGTLPHTTDPLFGPGADHAGIRKSEGGSSIRHRSRLYLGTVPSRPLGAGGL